MKTRAKLAEKGTNCCSPRNSYPSHIEFSWFLREASSKRSLNSNLIIPCRARIQDYIWTKNPLFFLLQRIKYSRNFGNIRFTFNKGLGKLKKIPTDETRPYTRWRRGTKGERRGKRRKVSRKLRKGRMAKRREKEEKRRQETQRRRFIVSESSLRCVYDGGVNNKRYGEVGETLCKVGEQKHKVWDRRGEARQWRNIS